MKRLSTLIIIVAASIAGLWILDGDERQPGIPPESGASPGSSLPAIEDLRPIEVETPHSASQDLEGIQVKKTPDALTIFGAPFHTSDHVGEYLALEANSLSGAAAAMDAFRIQEACKQVPAKDDVNPEMEDKLELTEARRICSEIDEAASLSRRELVELAADFGHPEAILLLPSFPPPFSSHGPGRASAEFLSWQERTVNRLESLSSQGSIDARLRLARLYAGEFPAYEDPALAFLYLEEILRSEHLTPSQEISAARLRERLPRPNDS